MTLRLVLFLIGMGLFFLLMLWQRSGDEETVTAGQNVLVFALVNLNVAILCVLIFLIGRNITKLVFDRRKKLLGSKLRTKLMIIFVGLTLVPSTFVFIMASGFLNRAVEGWFNTQVETSVAAAVEVAQQHFEYLKQDVARAGDLTAKSLGSRPAIFRDRRSIESHLEDLRKDADLYGISVLEDGKTQILEVHNAAAYVDPFQEPTPAKEVISKVLKGENTVLFEERGANQFVRAYNRVIADGRTYVVVSTLRVGSDLVSAIASVTDSYREYEQLKLFKNPLASGYTLTLAMITGLVIFGAIWIAFYIAKQIVVPIQKLAEGTRAIARGDYDFQIRKPADDELGYLVSSFNLMVSDLKQSRSEAEKRRLFIETILSNLAVGVIGVDREMRITSINKIAGRLFHLEDPGQALGKPLSSVLTPEQAEVVEGVARDVATAGDNAAVNASEAELHTVSDDEEHRVLCTAGVIRNPDKSLLGTLLLFDDITDLARAQAMSAWREVAQRIAHEIKNPLTPIQLSAQRLKKLIGDVPGRTDMIESAETIVENVETITRLANEFSKFARMPTAEFKSVNLDNAISDIVSKFAGTTPDIVFQFIADTKLPEIMLDSLLMRGVLVNLIDNAVSAMHTEERPEGADRPKIVVRTSYNRKERLVELEVADNGPGIPSSDKFRIFEPYFTTKPKGTGLGLAIVNTIIADHNGQIRVFDNYPRGARFLIKLPAGQRHSTQRRLAEV